VEALSATLVELAGSIAAAIEADSAP
jgi:hypothetical protein